MQELETSNILNLDETISKNIFDNATYPWEVLTKINDFIIKLGNELD